MGFSRFQLLSVPDSPTRVSPILGAGNSMTCVLLLHCDYDRNNITSLQEYSEGCSLLEGMGMTTLSTLDILALDLWDLHFILAFLVVMVCVKAWSLNYLIPASQSNLRPGSSWPPIISGCRPLPVSLTEFLQHGCTWREVRCEPNLVWKKTEFCWGG